MAQRIPTRINVRKRNRSARRHNALWPHRNVATPPGTPASSMTEVQGWSLRGQAQRFFFALTASATAQRQWTKMRGVPRWRSYRSGTTYSFAAWALGGQQGEDRWTGSVQGGQKLRSSRSSTFSLRFFAKRAEQKAEVRFLPFQCDEDRK